MTSPAAAYPLPRERNLILAMLLLLSAVAWAVLIWQSAVTDEDMSLTMGIGAPLFIALWVAMMVAVMFPTAAPMILMFTRIHNQRRVRGQSFVPTWVFVAAYMGVWSLTGLLAYGAAALGDDLAGRSGWVMDNAPRIGGALLAIAGIYQLSPLKTTCLSKCRSPMSFVLNSWRDGHAGALRMGVEHGVFCLGCCWLLFAILFPLGMMNVAAMAVITLLIFAEKSTPTGRQAAVVAAAGLVAYGLLVILVPDALPTTMSDSGMGGAGAMSDGGGMP